MGKTLREFAKEMSVLLPRLHREILIGQTRIIKAFDITFPQIIILQFLKGKPRRKMTEIAKFLSVTTSAATGIVDRMVRAGHLKRIRQTRDRRVVSIQLTPKGSRIINNFLRARHKMMMGIFRRFTSKERETYLKMIRKMCGTLTKDKK